MCPSEKKFEDGSCVSYLIGRFFLLIKGAEDVEKEIYNNDSITNEIWVPQTSDEFVADSVEVVLKIRADETVVYSPSRTFLDSVTFNLVE